MAEDGEEKVVFDAIARLERIKEVLLVLRDEVEDDRVKELLLDAANIIAWDDAIHIAAPWEPRSGLCGLWHRNLVLLTQLDEEGLLAGDGCWSCLQALGWLRQNTTSLSGELAEEIRLQDERHGPYGVEGGTPLGISRLALATLEDETREALDAWREERRVDGWDKTRREVLQVAAVAVRTLRDAL